MPRTPTRREVLIGLAASSLACFPRTEVPMSSPLQPVLFVGHGSPEHGVRDTAYSRAFTALGASLPRPRALLVISAHWETPTRATTANENPRTIHDFRGFPEDFYEVRYPAPGAPDLAARVSRMVGGETRVDWGLDHGTWSILRWMFPDADVPVVQLSMEQRRSAAEHVAIARRLAPLRREGVMIVGSGNITHNLRDAFTRRRQGDTTTPDWSTAFDADIAGMLEQHDLDALVGAVEHRHFAQAHPSPDHWWPLLYAAGASVGEGERMEGAVSFPITGFDWGSLSMRAARIG